MLFEDSKFLQPTSDSIHILIILVTIIAEIRKGDTQTKIYLMYNLALSERFLRN